MSCLYRRGSIWVRTVIHLINIYWAPSKHRYYTEYREYIPIRQSPRPHGAYVITEETDDKEKDTHMHIYTDMCVYIY